MAGELGAFDESELFQQLIELDGQLMPLKNELINGLDMQLDQSSAMDSADRDMAMFSAGTAVSSDDCGRSPLASDVTGRSPPADDQDNSAGGGSRKRSRAELNEAQRQRTNLINQQIQHLREVLENAGVETKRDKRSVLEAAGSYIAELQNIKVELEERCEAAESAVAPSAVHEQVLSSVAAMGPPQLFGSAAEAANGTRAGSIDYKLLFAAAPVPMAISRVDGQFVDCNRMFSVLSGFAQNEIQNFTMFNFTPAEDISSTFAIVSNMLTPEAREAERNSTFFWKQCSFRGRTVRAFIYMSLVRSPEGEPQYFHCVVLPLPQVVAGEDLTPEQMLKLGSAASAAEAVAQGERLQNLQLGQ